jgi:hypothetical protein
VAAASTTNQRRAERVRPGELQREEKASEQKKPEWVSFLGGFAGNHALAPTSPCASKRIWNIKKGFRIWKKGIAWIVCKCFGKLWLKNE